VRIITGKYGGRRLSSFKADHIRPTSDRVKESLFNILRDRWEGGRILDLFSGTGNLSFEALSRDAMSVTAVEQNPRSLEIIKKNKELLGVKEELKIVKADVRKFLKKYDGEPFDIILIDPPFTEKMADEVLQIVATSAAVGERSTVAIESASKETVAQSYGDLLCIDTRDFGDKILSFFERKKV
jgi:16S rRNA (guanine966-N2)-methyltransferase